MDLESRQRSFERVESLTTRSGRGTVVSADRRQHLPEPFEVPRRAFGQSRVIWVALLV